MYRIIITIPSGGTEGTERLSHLPEVTQLTRGGGRIRTQADKLRGLRDKWTPVKDSFPTEWSRAPHPDQGTCRVHTPPPRVRRAPNRPRDASLRGGTGRGAEAKEGGARGSARGRVSKECRPWPGTPASRLPAAAGEALSHGEAPAPRPARCLRALGPALAPAPPLGLPPPPPPREYPGARGVGRGRGAGHQGAAARLAQPALDA